MTKPDDISLKHLDAEYKVFKAGYENVIRDIAKILAEQFGTEPPCNFNDNDCFMVDNCENFCENHCFSGDTNVDKCWEEFLKAKLKVMKND